MMLFYSQMMQAIDLVKEDKRLSAVEFAKDAAPRPAVRCPLKPRLRLPALPKR